MRARVNEKQRKMKAYTDKKRNVKEHKFRIGDVVCVKLPFHVSKEKGKYSAPSEIIKVEGNCVTLSDQRKWNVSKLVKCVLRNDDELIQSDIDDDPPPDQVPTPSLLPMTPPEMPWVQPGTPRLPSTRDRKVPIWMKDYKG